MDIQTLEQEQTELERECVGAGVSTYRNRLLRQQEKGLLTLSKPERSLLQSAEKVREALIIKIMALRKKPGRRATALPLLESIDADVAAVVALRVVVDLLRKPNTVQFVAIRIGRMIELENRLEAFEATKPALYKTIERHIGESPRRGDPNYRQRVRIHALNKYHIAAHNWTTDEKMHVGMFMLDIVVTETGIVQKEMLKGRRVKDNRLVLVVNPDLEQWLLKQHAHCEMLQPQRLPMVCPPKPFVGTTGGYLTPQVSKPLVSVRDKALRAEYTAEKMPHVFRAVNTLQAVQQEVNSDVFGVMDTLWNGMGEVPGAARRDDFPLPDKPVGDDLEERAIYKARAREVADANLGLRGQRVVVSQSLSIARRFDKRPIWFPMFLDFRGRTYTTCNYLTPQGSDLAKGLLRFHKPMEIGTEDGARWLQIHAANCAGVDKVSMDDRVQWVHEHREDIEKSAADPLSYRWWAEQDSPTAFLAVCFELARFWRDGLKAPTQIVVSTDGSCNGIQHLAAMSWDATAGALVNLVPSDKPSDIYGRVADVTIEMLNDEPLLTELFAKSEDPFPLRFARPWLDFGIKRDITKRGTMILPYNGTRSAVEKYIDMTLTDRMKAGQLHPFGKDRHDAVFFLSRVMWKAMAQVVVGPRAVQSWTKLVAQMASKSGNPIVWGTDSGFRVQQSYKLMTGRKVQTRLDGGRVVLTVSESTDQLDHKRQATALAPNWIHSMDAAALHLTVCRLADLGVTDMVAVHDSYGTHAPNVSLMQRVLREAFVSIYEDGKAMQRFADVIASACGGSVEIPSPPPLGTLNVGEVRNSPYFFA